MGCPPLPGKFPTCYAPVCRYPLAGIARLACLIHAASVRSEPGSNSPSNMFPAFRRSFRRGAFEVIRSGEAQELADVGQHVLNCQRALLNKRKKERLLSKALASKEVRHAKFVKPPRCSKGSSFFSNPESILVRRTAAVKFKRVGELMNQLAKPA